MTRPLRANIEGGWYHVTSRGANKQCIFTSDVEHHLFLRLLRKATDRFGIEIHAYALMGNHYHLLIRTPLANLSQAMHLINCAYAMNFNRLNCRSGPVFERRFFASLIDTEQYLHAAARYIHRNPVEAGLVARAVDWQWSSMAAVAGLRRSPSWLTVADVRRGFKTASEYTSMVDNPSPGLPDYERRPDEDLPVIGRADFVEGVLANMTIGIEERPGQRRALPRSTLTEIELAVIGHFEVTRADLLDSTRGVFNAPRAIACWIARQESGESLVAIAEWLDFGNYRGASTSNFRLKRRLLVDDELRNSIDSITNSLARVRRVA